MLRPAADIDRGSLELVTPPAAEPVTLADAKTHMRVDTTLDDAYITLLITAARQFVENWTRRALIYQTWRLVFDHWPGGNAHGPSLDRWWDGTIEGPLGMLGSQRVKLRKAPFAISQPFSVTIYNEDGSVALLWDPSNYYLITDNGWAWLVKRVGQIWPLIVPPVRQRGGIIVQFVAGYSADASLVPIALQQAIKDIVLHWYEVREAVGETSRWHPPMKTAAILEQYKMGR